MDMRAVRFLVFLMFVALGSCCHAQGVSLPTARPLEERVVQELTPTEEFFVIQVGKTPRIDVRKWRLGVRGMVNRRLSLSLSDFASMKQVEQVVTIECIENVPSGELIGTGRWGGVLLSDILSRAGVKGSPRTIVFRAADGYAESIPYSFLNRSPVMVVTHLNGKTLPVAQGYPARLIMPGLYGMKNVKWVQSIELVSGEFTGFWEERGWSDKAEVFVKSWIYCVDPYSGGSGDMRIRGVAYAGLEKISRVQVSIDGGEWQPATIDKSVGRFAWSIWSYRWRTPPKGTHALAVRAFDSAGRTQPVVDEDYRDGNNGIQAVKYEVR